MNASDTKRTASPGDAPERVTLQGVEVTLAQPDDHRRRWLDYDDLLLQMEAAWLRLTEEEPPLNPRIVGAPGMGKTSLAYAAAERVGLPVYTVQCTADMRPEDLVITPVLADDRRIEYRASGVVTAMVRGGVALLDEANRMPERSWASLAPLLDERRHVESIVAGIAIRAGAGFRLCVTMNEDASVYELPDYIRSRLKPTIEVGRPPWDLQQAIVRMRCPGIPDELLEALLDALEDAYRSGERHSTRDLITVARFARQLRDRGADEPVERALEQVLERDRG